MKNSNYNVGDLIYDGSIYDGMNTFLSDLQFYKRWLPKTKDARVLELCCGTGRLTIPIAMEGYNICGVDHTPSMLEQAKVKASKEGVDIEFIEGDMRTFDFPEKYDLIFIPFNSIHHLYTNEDLFKTLNTVKKHLKNGGTFIFDCFNPSIHHIVEGEKGLKEVSRYKTEDGREIVIKETMRYESNTQINRIEWQFFINGEFDSIQRLDMRMFYPQELNTYLGLKGFNIVHKFGSFEEETFSAQSGKQIFVCE